MIEPLTIAIVGDYDETFTPHLATDEALDHAARSVGVTVHARWLPTADLESDLTSIVDSHAVWCAPGAPYRSMAGVLAALRLSREQGIPTLGTCGGCQHMIIEFARTVLGIEDADHAEYDPYASRLIISKLDCSLAGRTMAVNLAQASLAEALYGTSDVREQYYCNFGLNVEYQPLLEQAGFHTSGADADGEPRVFELAGHPFYLATLFVPQTRSTPERPHPVICGFLAAARKRAQAATAATVNR